MYQYSVVLLLVGLVLCVVGDCNTTYPFTFQQTNNSKVGSTNKLRLGIVGSFSPGDILPCLAIAHELNEDPTILPGVEIQLYETITPTTSDVLLASLFQISTVGVQGLISGYTSTESRTAQLVAKIYNTPQISPNCLTSILNDKSEYPYFMRTNPSDIMMIDAIIALFQDFEWTRGIIIYTTEDYGMDYSKLVLAGQDANITFDSISVSASALTQADIADSMDSLRELVDKTQYRVFIHFSQPLQTNLVRDAMNASGLIGPEYVHILTASNNAFYIDGIKTTPYNNGALAVAITQPYGDTYTSLMNAWRTSTTNPFPIPPNINITSWYMIDALLAFVYAYDNLTNSGVAAEDINTEVYFEEIMNNTFTGTTGLVVFNSVGDRLGNYDIYTMGPTWTKDVATYSALTGDLVETGTFLFWDNSTDIPEDGPYICGYCQNGDCVAKVGCVCHPGYSGTTCSDKKQNNAWVIGVVVGVVVVLFIGLAMGYSMYRRKKNELVKEVTEKQRSNINRTDLNLGTRIGRGASGEVYKAVFRGTEVAVKKIVTSNVDSSVIQEFELEVAIMCGLRHPNIILFMGSCFDTSSKEMLLVMEFMTRGSLHDVLHNPKIEMNYDMKLHLACQAAQGMNFLHQSSPPIIHRDLKSHNILLDDKWNARISDFGITKFKDSTKKAAPKAETSIGTILWTSPEALDGAEQTEKSDVYSFGIVLWEIFHRQDPYLGRDPVSVAIDVIQKDLRPTMHPDVPKDMQELIRSCWNKDPTQRPSFQEIMTRLRSLSLKNPMYSLGGGGSVRVDAPTGQVFLVNTNIIDAFSLWEQSPHYMREAVKLHNALLRSTMEQYRGYEANHDHHSFMIAFGTAEDAINFCVATQVSLLHVEWPVELLQIHSCGAVMSPKGNTLWWKGLRVRMSVHVGVPNCEVDPSTGRMIYMGPAVEKSQRVLRLIKEGTLVITDPVLAEINKHKISVVQEITTRKCGEMNISARDSLSAVHQVMIKGLEGRETNSGSSSTNSNHPHSIVDMEITPIESTRSLSGTHEVSADWVANHRDITLKEPIGKGQTGDFHRALWKSQEVVVKTLVNQKLKEDDMLKLLGDAAYMSKLTHPNILGFRGVCVDPNNISIISEYMPRGSLKAVLADPSIPLTLSKRMKIAHDVASGMAFLDSLDDEEMRKHDNLKSNNILIGKDWEVKIADYGQSNIKDLARTMTSVGSVAWTAPEILNGETEKCTPRIAIYSFGICLWEIYTRQIPYANEHPIRVVSKILNGYRPPISPDCPTALKQLIEQCLAADPEDRPSWDQIVSILAMLMKS